MCRVTALSILAATAKGLRGMTISTIRGLIRTLGGYGRSSVLEFCLHERLVVYVMIGVMRLTGLYRHMDIATSDWNDLQYCLIPRASCIEKIPP
jgi:hypothetical protein